MGELYLDHIERTTAKESLRRDIQPETPVKPRTVVSRYPLLHCATCRQPIRRARIIEGKPYCAVHASEQHGDHGSRPATKLLDTWFGRKNNGRQTSL